MTQVAILWLVLVPELFCINLHKQAWGCHCFDSNVLQFPFCRWTYAVEQGTGRKISAHHPACM